MPDSIMYHDGNRRLQDRFDSRRISDRLEEKLTRTQFTPDDKTFIREHTIFLPRHGRRRRTARLQWRIENLCAGLVRLPG
jgi:hypothetical protein